MNEYLFAFYVFVLICGVLVLVKYLFSDVKRQQLMLEEKESKLLRLYQTLEEVMDEFYDSVEVSRAEMSETLDKVNAGAAEIVAKMEQVYAAENATIQKKRGSNRKASNKTEQVEEVSFQPLVPPEAPDVTETVTTTRTDSILELSRQGKDRSDIAKELNITLSEVDLVIGINKP